MVTFVAIEVKPSSGYINHRERRSGWLDGSTKRLRHKTLTLETSVCFLPVFFLSLFNSNPNHRVSLTLTKMFLCLNLIKSTTESVVGILLNKRWIHSEHLYFGNFIAIIRTHICKWISSSLGWEMAESPTSHSIMSPIETNRYPSINTQLSLNWFIHSFIYDSSLGGFVLCLYLLRIKSSRPNTHLRCWILREEDPLTRILNEEAASRCAHIRNNIRV